MAELHQVTPHSKDGAVLDVVFVHGLGGDKLETWQSDKDTASFWPAWLAKDITGIAVYSLGYEASPSAWLGHAMPLADQSNNALALLEAEQLGGRPLVFVCHSLGGLLVKQMLRGADTLGQTAWQTIALQTRAVVFLATPHAGASLADYLYRLGKLARATAAIDVLRANEPNLRELATWYSNNVARLGIVTRAYFETRDTMGMRIVDETSANPGISGIVPIGVNADHQEICKPVNCKAYIYKCVRGFIADVVKTVISPSSPMPTPSATEITQGPTPNLSADSVHCSNSTLIRRGRMRTAYPTDLSFAQLYDQELYIEPRMSAFRDGGALTAASSPELAVTDVIEKLIAHRSVLVLGEPGAGKSFLTYLIQRRLVEQGADATCLDFLDLLDTIAASGLSAEGQEIIILDGLDEGHVEGARLTAATSLSTVLSVRGRILCVCRREDYELALCRILPSQCFDEILFVLPWRPDIEFPQFVEKLAVKHYARAPEILSAVRGVLVLQSLVTRPLHARMLCYLWQDDETSSPMMGQDLTFLYEAYMRKFARSVAGASAAAWTEQDVLAQWRALAWSVFRGESAHRGRIEARTLADLLDDRPTLQRAVHGILDRVDSARGEYYQFLHHSFYEFLVSWEFFERLRSACSTDNAVAAVALFRRDMPREIRHHAVTLLSSDGFASSSVLTHFLARIYDLARQEENAERSLLETCNLIVYFLSRCSTESASPHLSRLLSTETLSFLRTSLYWGAAAADMIACTSTYVDELLGNKEMRALNRGYHLYYYGDMNRQTAPPYEDNDSAANWSRTRSALGERTRLQQSGPIAKCYLDIVTFLDLAHFHATTLNEAECRSIKLALARMKDIWGEQVTRVCQASVRDAKGDL